MKHLSDKYLVSMIVGDYFSKSLVKLDSDRYIYDAESLMDWSGSEECATFAEAVYHLAFTVNVGVRHVARTVYDMIMECGFETVVDHDWDDFTRGFLAGERFGSPTYETLAKVEKAETLWWGDMEGKYGYYQEVLDEVEKGE